MKQEKIDFINRCKVDTNELNKVLERKELLRNLEENEELLEMLSKERLKKLAKYYACIIKQNDKKIVDKK